MPPVTLTSTSAPIGSRPRNQRVISSASCWLGTRKSISAVHSAETTLTPAPEPDPVRATGGAAGPDRAYFRIGRGTGALRTGVSRQAKPRDQLIRHSHLP